MDSFRSKSTLLLLLTCFPQLESSSIASYVASVIQTIAQAEPGVHECVFYGTQLERPFDNVLGRVLRAPELAFVPKTVVSMRFPYGRIETPMSPALLVLQGEAIGVRWRTFYDEIRKFKAGVPVVVLYSEKRDFEVYELLLVTLRCRNVWLLDVQLRRVTAVSVGRRVHVDHLPRPDHFYKRAVRVDMQGRPVTYATRAFRSNGIDPDQSWAVEAARLANTTLREVAHNCSSTDLEGQEDCYVWHLVRNRITLTTTGYRLRPGTVTRGFELLHTSRVEETVLLVPRSPLTIVQLFTMPFEWQVWTVLAIVLVTVEIVHLLFPTIIRNRPILLIVCGYEDYDLNRCGLEEKFLLHSLMIVMFFMTSAYETRLLSMMVSKPATREIKTIEDLLESGLQVKVDPIQDFGLESYSTLGDRIVNTSETIMELDMVHARITQRHAAEMVLWKYYDPVHRLHRYSVIDQTFGVAPIAYVFLARQEVIGVFDYTMQVFVESGIYEYLRRQLESCMKRKIYGQLTIETDDALYFGDLYPVWVIFAGGTGFGLVAFILEFVFHKLPDLIREKSIKVALSKVLKTLLN